MSDSDASTSGTQPGKTAAGTHRFDEEIRAFLQKRLRILTGVLSLILGLLSTLFVVSMAITRGSVSQAAIEFATEFPNAILFFLLLITSGSYLVLRSRSITPGWLAFLDGALLEALIGVCLLLYARLHSFSFSGFAFVVTFLVLFILTRAVLVPSTAARTLALSLPAPIGVLAIQLSYGESFAFPGEPYRHSHFVDTLIQNQVCLLGAVAVAVVASRVNLSLRRRNFDARRVGQYRLRQQIGAGAMGEVYLATHSLLKREAALKFLRPEITGEESLARFEQEVRLASRLTHPNTISIYDYGYTAEGAFYYAMELLSGATLKEVVEATGPMPAGRAIHVLAQALSALREAHDKNILHRDIKAANIMLCEQGGELDRVKILDFGLAKPLEAGSGVVRADGTVAGSPETLSPEAISGRDVGPASDLYSLSVVAYLLVAGRLPFAAESAQEMVGHHLSTSPVAPSEHGARVPSDLEGLILQGLSKDPVERPADARTYRSALLRCDAAGDWTEEEARSWWQTYEHRQRPARDDSEISSSSAETLIR